MPEVPARRWSRRRVIAVSIVVATPLLFIATYGAFSFAGRLQQTQSDLQLSLNASRETTETLAATSDWDTLIELEGSGTRRTDTFKVSGGRVLVRLRAAGPNESQESAAMLSLMSLNPLRFGEMRSVWSPLEGGETAVILEVSPGSYYATIQGFGSWEAVVAEP